MAYKRRIIVIKDNKLAQVNTALELAGFGSNFFTVPCNASGRRANPATDWCCDVQLSASRYEKLIAILSAIPGVSLKIHNEGKANSKPDRVGTALGKEGIKVREKA